MSIRSKRETKLEIVADNLKKLREKRFPGHGGKKACADAMGLQLQQWSPWELGQKIPRNVNMIKIASFFGVTVDKLMTDTRGIAVEAAFPSVIAKKQKTSTSYSPKSEANGEELMVMGAKPRAISNEIKKSLKSAFQNHGFDGILRFRFSVTGIEFDDV